MQNQKRSGCVPSGWLFWVAIVCLLAGPLRAQTNDTTATTPITVSTNATDAASQMSTLQLQALADFQTQMQAMMKSMENNRLEIANMLSQNSSNNVAQLATMAEMMSEQRSQDLTIVRNEHRIGMAIVVGLAGLLLLSIVFLNLTAIKAINRMTTMFSATSLMPGSEAQALADAHEAEKLAKRQLVLFPGEQGQRQLGNAVVQLQSRIAQLEHLASRIRPDARPAASADSGNPQVPTEEKTSHRIR